MAASRRREENAVPLLYTSLTTQRQSDPKWILILSSPLPIPVQHVSLGNDVCSSLLSAKWVVALPPYVSNVADSCIWLLNNTPFPLATYYHIVVKKLYLSCQPLNNRNPSMTH
jgi:hypothetical protein